MSEHPIHFGTSGHRGLLGKSFSLKHVEAICHAIADFVLEKNDKPRIAIGYDPREGNSPQLKPGSYTGLIVNVLTSRGVAVDFCQTYAPTPVVSWYVQTKGCDGGIILTASHNPPQYNGIKFNPKNGAPAPSEVTTQLEDQANHYFFDMPTKKEPNRNLLRLIAPEAEFISAMLQKISAWYKKPLPDFSATPVAVDAKYGAVANTWQLLFTSLGLTQYKILHADPMSDFGGIEPNPTKFDTLSELIQWQKKLGAAFAFANDPDGDRHVVLDENGQHLTPEEVSVIILDFLLANQVPVYGMATTVASSQIVKQAVQKNHLEFKETSVGFKYFAPFLEKARKQNKLGLAVESSGGFSYSEHTLEKCGFLPCLLMMLIVAATGKSLSALRSDIQEKYGRYYFSEAEATFDGDKRDELLKYFTSLEASMLSEKMTTPIAEIIKVDGVKISFINQDWLLVRLSGTEPLARIYAESSDPERSKQLLEFGKSLLK